MARRGPRRADLAAEFPLRRRMRLDARRRGAIVVEPGPDHRSPAHWVSAGDDRHAQAEAVSPPLPMKTKTNSVIYYLYFASQKPVAAGIVDQIFGTYRKRQIGRASCRETFLLS